MLSTHPFTVHNGIGSYTAGLRDPEQIPVMDQVGDRIGGLAEMIEARAACGDPEISGVLVVVPPGSAAAAAGRALADRFLGDFAEGTPSEMDRIIAHQRVQHVVLLALTDELSIEMVLDALEGIMGGGQRAGFGIVMGRTLAEVSWLLAKGLSSHLRKPADRSQLCVAPWGSPSDADTSDTSGAHWVTGDRVRRAVLRPLLCDQRTGLLSFAAAGREHAMIFTDTVVCGADPNIRTTVTAGGRLPSCAFSGECFREGISVPDVIRADLIRADVIYANSCMSWRPGHGLVAPGYQLTNAFHRGIAAAFIGAVHQMVPDVRLNELAHAAAAAGASAGQLGVLLNDHVRREGAGLPYYVVMGLPWVAPRGTVAGARRDGDPWRRPADHGSLREQRIRSVLRQTGQTVEALRDLPLLGFLPAGGLPAIDAEVSALVAALKGMPSVVRPSAATDPTLKLRDLVADAELDVAGDFHDLGQMSDSALNEIWEDFLDTRMSATGDRCSYCAGRLAELTGLHPAYPRLRRRALFCHVCGPVLDLPGEPVIDAIFIECADTWERPGTARLEISITPAATLKEETNAAVTVHASKGVRLGLTFPEAQQVRMLPGRPVRLRIQAQLDPQALPHHEHSIRVILIARGLVHGASRPVAVRPGG
jgi:hypothetical protein